jgi:hypothetical protein
MARRMMNALCNTTCHCAWLRQNNSMRISWLSCLPARWDEIDPVRKCRLPEDRKAGYTSLNADTGACFRHCSGLGRYQAAMTDCFRHRELLLAAPIVFALSLGGCAEMNDTMTTAFADPAKYELYDCKQLEPERKALANRAAELQGLMAKAETGFAGPVVAQMAYSNDYIAVRGQSRLAEEAWQKNHCHETPPPPPAAKPVAPTAAKKSVKPVARSKPDASVY